MSLRVADDEESLSREVAGQVADLASESVRRRGRFTFALSGGGTPRKLYARLAQEPFKSRMPWKETLLFWEDERFVPQDDPDSNYRMVREALLTQVPLPEANVHPVPVQLATAGEAAAEYERRLRKFFLNEDPPSFDLILLGLGEDGHTASLFPGTDALAEKERWAVNVTPPAAEHERVTLTFLVINAARHVIFLAAGRKKSGVIKEVLQGPPRRYPAQLVRPASGRLDWWVDRAAAP